MPLIEKPAYLLPLTRDTESINRVWQRYLSDNGISHDRCLALPRGSYIHFHDGRGNSFYLHIDKWSAFVREVWDVTSFDAAQCGCLKMTYVHHNVYNITTCPDCQTKLNHCTNCDKIVLPSQERRISTSEAMYCPDCSDNFTVWCRRCNGYQELPHEDCSCCHAPHVEFKFPFIGDTPIKNDERKLIELPGGVISDVGMAVIAEHLYTSDMLSEESVQELLDELSPVWQTNRGNFTRRLSSALYKNLNIKLSRELMSEIGNAARAHTTTENNWYIEFTRKLNGTARSFAHSGSCWWSEYEESRCALKSWGGMAIRSYADDDSFTHQPTGRAWVHPLNKDLCPTHSADAFAYVVFNGYGNLDGYTPARIIAQLTGKSYRKIKYDSSQQYVNNKVGYLVAPPEVIAETSEIEIGGGKHHKYDAESISASDAIPVPVSPSVPPATTYGTGGDTRVTSVSR